VAPADHQRMDRGGRKEDRVISHKSSRSSPPSIRRETAATSSGGHEPRPGPSRGSPPPIEASRKKSRLESPKGHSPKVSEITIVKTVTKKKRESKKKLVTRSPMVITEDMLPSRNWYIRDGKLIYKPHRETIFQCSTTLKEERTWLRTLSFPLRPMGFVDSLLKPSKLPVPQGKDDVPKELIRHPGMMLMPRPRFEDCHSGRCGCVVHGMRDVDHRTSVLHDVCLRSGAMTEKDLAVEPRFKNFVENPSHYYYWSESKRDHLLGVPQPFRNNGSWTPAFFNPVLSDCSDKVAAQFYLDIYSKENARRMACIYMTPPSKWESTSHPCLGEPEVGSELWRQSHLLYGVESVPRMNYCQHPLAEDFFYLFLAADPDSLLVPVIQRDPSTPDLPDKIIGRLLEPFWRHGWGRVLCSVCLAEVYNGELQPVFLTRNEFLQHWVKKHLSSLVAVMTFSATRLNSRLYQGHALYLLASHADYSRDLTDSPILFPTDFSGFQASITHSNILSKAMRKPSSQQTSSSSAPAPAPAPAPVSSQQTPPAPSVDSFQIPADLIFPSAQAASFAATYNPNTDADGEKLLDSKEGDADASAEVGSESMLDLDDAAMGICNMDTDDHKEFPTPSEAYMKKPPISDADAVKMAKKGAKKR
jgi:hypothetical protein